MELNIKGIDVSISNAVIEQLVRERLAAGRVQTFTRDDMPAIGAAYNGGICAGLTIVDDEPQALVLLPGDNDCAEWKTQMEWAEKQDAVLPSRFDALVLFKNLKREFMEEAYWTSEKHASSSGYAWYQHFSGGDQGYGFTDYTLRARAVRRIPLSNLSI